MTAPGPSHNQPGGRVITLKVVEPYFEALLSGDKTFEVRRNDRGFQTGDRLILVEWIEGTTPVYDRKGRVLTKRITYVYSGDPRFGDWPAGTVVLGLGDPS